MEVPVETVLLIYILEERHIYSILGNKFVFHKGID